MNAQQQQIVKQAVLTKLATARLAVNHVLRARAMQKQAEIPGMVNAQSYGYGPRIPNNPPMRSVGGYNLNKPTPQPAPQKPAPMTSPAVPPQQPQQPQQQNFDPLAGATPGQIRNSNNRFAADLQAGKIPGSPNWKPPVQLNQIDPLTAQIQAGIQRDMDSRNQRPPLDWEFDDSWDREAEERASNMYPGRGNVNPNRRPSLASR